MSFLSFSAKWSSNEEVNKFGQAKTGSGSSEKKVWTPANGAESPSLERRKAKDYKPVGFDGNSLNRSEQKSNKVGGRSQTTFTDFWPFLTPPPPLVDSFT